MCAKKINSSPSGSTFLITLSLFSTNSGDPQNFFSAGNRISHPGLDISEVLCLWKVWIAELVIWRLGFLLGASQQAFLQKGSMKWIPGIVKIGCFQGKRRAVLGLVLCRPDCLPGASLLCQLLKLSYKIKLHQQGVSPQAITQEKNHISKNCLPIFF